MKKGFKRMYSKTTEFKFKKTSPPPPPREN